MDQKTPTRSPVVLCGVEEPTNPGLQLYAFNEATGISELGFDKPVDPSVNRYSFSLGESPDGKF